MQKVYPFWASDNPLCKNTVYTVYIFIYMVLANPTHTAFFISIMNMGHRAETIIKLLKVP
jgi:hypothetical protein